MSGHHTYTDPCNSRRHFLKQLLALLSLPATATLPGCSNRPVSKITGGIVGANAAIGHLLRDPGGLPPSTETVEADVLIVGGGISALAARRWLHLHSQRQVTMIEMDTRIGGNSVSGKNDVSAYPWAAHYLPIPDVANTELIDFLKAAGVITGTDGNGLPVYNEYYLCHDPEERLFFNGLWQEGLVPATGINNTDRQQISRFLIEAETLKNKVGADGRRWFAIPLENSSADAACRALDKLSFHQYLLNNGYTSPPLRWYLEYCCKDDYGSDLQNTSAWAGLHYFASRNGKAANASSSAVLTWPEGNGFLMQKLADAANTRILTSTTAISVAHDAEAVSVVCYDVNQKKTFTIRAAKALMCTPQYVNKRLLGMNGPRSDIYGRAEYAPWIVANITLTRLPATNGAPLCWDNVVYGRQAVGYVFANHQDLHRKPKGVITYYLPLTFGSPSEMRKAMRSKSYEQWRDEIIADLSFAHPGIADTIANIDIWQWGHGMICPAPGYIWGPERQQALLPLADKVFFAHTDLSGISIFEEAFYQGIRAAKEIIATT